MALAIALVTLAACSSSDDVSKYVADVNLPAGTEKTADADILVEAAAHEFTLNIHLRKELHKLGVQAAISSAKWDYWQALLSRGDGKLTDFIIEVYKNGGKLGAFKKAAKELNINTDYYASENYDYDKDLPWDFIERKPGKDFLKKECIRLINS